jgi:AmiR/NasT family two-component response regulator
VVPSRPVGDQADSDRAQSLRVLVANERPERLEHVSRLLREAGHTVVGETTDIAEAGLLTQLEDPDVAFVAVGSRAGHALDQVETIAEEASCPIVIVLEETDPAFVAEAARRGVFGHATDTSPEELQSTVEIALRRFEDMRELERAFRRRAIVERAKGILMERHGESEREAFERLRGHARRSQRRIVTVAEAVLATYELLPSMTKERAGD